MGKKHTKLSFLHPNSLWKGNFSWCFCIKYKRTPWSDRLVFASKCQWWVEWRIYIIAWNDIANTVKPLFFSLAHLVCTQIARARTLFWIYFQQIQPNQMKLFKYNYRKWKFNETLFSWWWRFVCHFHRKSYNAIMWTHAKTHKSPDCWN